MKKFLILALLLSGCKFVVPWTHQQVYSINGNDIEAGPTKATMSIDNMNHKTYLNFRNELGRPQRVDITNDKNWICAEKQSA